MLSSNPVTANLIKARELIADEKNWCQVTLHNAAGQFCAIGALDHVDAINPDEKSAMCRAALEMIPSISGFNAIVIINDDGGHAAVMKLFDRAIEISLQEP